HDVETALNAKQTASLLTLDVKEAFDGVLPGRLTRRLREQGWPNNLVRWVKSFTTGRRAMIWLDGTTGAEFNVPHGLPQRSPVCPILFMLYLAPLFQLGSPSKRFGYADDVAFFQISKSLHENANLLAKDLRQAINWASEEGITFDPDKFGLLHFSRRRTDQDPRTTPNVEVDPLNISEDADRPYIRWLGVLLDKKLTFKWHARSLAAKSLKVSQALSSLGNTARGVPPHLLRQAVVSCVLPVMYYAAETWWPVRTREGPRARISNRVDTSLQLFSKVVLTAARAILPVYRTTPSAALHRESGLAPPEIALEQRTLVATVRLRRLDPRHPLLRRAIRVLALGRPTSRFARRILALPASEQINLIATPPWAPREGQAAAQARVGGPNGQTRDQAKEKFLSFLRTVPLQDIVLFSDGSKQLDGSAGAGFVAYQGGVQVLKQSFALGKGNEVFDAEAKGALAGAKAALALPSTKFATNLWICLDNLEVATRLLSPFPGSSQATFDEFLELNPRWQARPR
ncbi:hypothetical protein K3495_g15299, partial [Podosphaera aphanis]